MTEDDLENKTEDIIGEKPQTIANVQLQDIKQKHPDSSVTINLHVGATIVLRGNCHLFKKAFGRSKSRILKTSEFLAVN